MTLARCSSCGANRCLELARASGWLCRPAEDVSETVRSETFARLGLSAAIEIISRCAGPGIELCPACIPLKRVILLAGQNPVRLRIGTLVRLTDEGVEITLGSMPCQVKLKDLVGICDSTIGLTGRPVT